MAPGELLGRGRELRALESVIAGARNRRGGALALVGDAGIGKTALLDAAARAAGVKLLRIDGFEAEAAMPFAAVHRLLLPLREHLTRLPAGHREALAVATGLGAGSPPDRFLVGLGVLGLLALVGEQTPVVCLVDDAHLLDPESGDVLAFVARRVEAESVAVLLAAREPVGAGIPTLDVAGLERPDAVRLLTAAVPADIDPAVAAAVVDATGGNPLALLDLSGELSVRQLTETSFGIEPVPVGRHLEQFYLRRVRSCGEAAREWLLLAAAEATGNLDLVQSAGDELDLDRADLVRAEEAGLLDLGSDVRFRHPLVRSAAYNAAPGRERRRSHQALSVAAEKLDLPDLAVWHAARGTLGTDEAVARRLELVADEAGRRGGSASRARMLHRAATLTPAGTRRNGRLVRAAEAALAAGTSQMATNLTDEIDEDQLDDPSTARLLVLRADVALFTATPEVTCGAAQALAAAELFHGHDPDVEQLTLLRAWELALPAERRAVDLDWAELGRRLRAGAERRPGVAATVLRALAALLLEPFPDAVPELRAAVAAYDAMSEADLLRFGHASVAVTTALWDEAARSRCLNRWADAARDTGAVHQLDTALWVMALTASRGGSPALAGQYMDRVRELRRAIGYDAEHVVNVPVLTWQGVPRDEIVRLALATRDAGFGGVHSAAMVGVANFDLAAGRYEQAFTVLDEFVQDPFGHTTPLVWPDHAEAALRSGRVDVARSSAECLRQRAQDCGTPWALGLSQRTRALLGEAPEENFRSSVEQLSRTGLVVELGRTHLALGEWLRRRRRRAAAREELQQAASLFRAAEATPFLDRAGRELQALGDSVSPGAGPVPGLTAQELTVARLVSQGATNAEVAASMFLSPNTVDYHLRKVFAKLHVSSRRQLADKLRGTT